MISVKILALAGLTVLLKFSSATPDSAGIVEMVNGLAYGGIPYGSVTGMLARYAKPASSEVVPLRITSSVRTVPQPVVITPNVRASGLATRSHGPVQIYNTPGVVAPGIVGTISQIGY